MAPNCPHCTVETVPFAVPPPLREYAPEEAETAAICPRCLRVSPAEAGPTDPDFDAVASFFPSGDGGVATALLVGLLDSLALNRRAIEAVAAQAERRGVDVLLVVDRLSTTVPDPYVDLERRSVQLQQLLT
jgi:hypothetical protein